MRKSHFITVAALALTLCTSLFGAEVPASPAPAGVVNINTADASQLSYLPRVGEKAAERVVEFRTAHGPFHKTTDLMQVKGFGEKKYESISSFLTVSGPTTLAAKVRKTRASHTSHTRKPRKAKASTRSE